MVRKDTLNYFIKKTVFLLLNNKIYIPLSISATMLPKAGRCAGYV